MNSKAKAPDAYEGQLQPGEVAPPDPADVKRQAKASEQKKSVDPPLLEAHIAQTLHAATTRLNDIVEKLARAVDRNPEAVAAIGAQEAPTPEQAERYMKYAQHQIELKALGKTVHDNGDTIAYHFPLTHIRSLPYQLTDGAAAFTERGVMGGRSHIEIHGGSDYHIGLAMKHAAMRYAGADVKIHINPESKHAVKVIEHAVREGLNVVNQDPRIQALVIAERERQANPLVRDLRFADQNFAMIERVPAGGSAFAKEGPAARKVPAVGDLREAERAPMAARGR